MQFCYSHLSGKCQRKVLFGNNAKFDNACCDICKSGVMQMEDRLHKLKLLVMELGSRGEVKITDWIRGGQLSWMKDIDKILHI